MEIGSKLRMKGVKLWSHSTLTEQTNWKHIWVIYGNHRKWRIAYCAKLMGKWSKRGELLELKSIQTSMKCVAGRFSFSLSCDKFMLWNWFWNAIDLRFELFVAMAVNWILLDDWMNFFFSKEITQKEICLNDVLKVTLFEKCSHKETL